MIFDNIQFIKSDDRFVREYTERSPAPMFRKKFTINKTDNVNVHICALGFGYCWINGTKVTDELFCAPVSDYNKTLWFNTYDVSHLLTEGENVIAVMCGNGWYNEPFETPWGYEKASWRDNPKFILCMERDGNILASSDDTWKCSTNSPIIYNQLRSGEYFDSRLYDENWNKLSFDDSHWHTAVKDTNPPKGVFRKYSCQPVRECAEYPTKEIIKAEHNRYIFDIGQNISGYIRLKVKQKAGDEIIIRYAEQINSDNTLQLNDMDNYYPESPFQTDRFICNGEEFVWSPLFAYHGFRYIELTGIENPTPDTVSGIFVHLDIKNISGFECSDSFLNHMFKIGQMATWSNLQHTLTDCPTREKLGWANDAQASTEQILMNFDSERFFKKWLTDIIDSIDDEGAIPGMIPTCGWGYEWGTGPVSTGVLFEVPYKLYLYTGDDTPLKECLPSFMKHLIFLHNKADADGLIGFGLCDWAGPFETMEAAPVPVKFTDSILYIKFLKIALLAAKKADDTKANGWLSVELERFTSLFMNEYINDDGTCKIHEQTAVSMLIYHNVYSSLEPLANQLKKTVEEHDYHHNCGMVGLRHLFHALNISGAPEYAYKVITASGYPSFRKWVDGDATTLWESWQPGNSKNHHMYSDFMLWLMTTLVGIVPTFDATGFKEVLINPSFIPQISYCTGYRETKNGKIEVSWKKENDGVHITIVVPDGVKARWKDSILEAGDHSFVV